MSFEIDGQQRIVNSAGGTMFVFGLPDVGRRPPPRQRE